MKNKQQPHLYCSSNEDDETESTGSGSYCWWRSDPKGGAPGEPEPVSAARLEPRVRVVRELERLASAAQEHNGVSELRHKLVTYRCGDFWMPTGGIPKDKTDIPEVSTVLLLGLSGSGKSSLVNLMYSVLGRSGLVPFAHTSSSSSSSSGNSSNYTSMLLEEHNVIRSLRAGFCVYDSRGFDSNQMSEGHEELSSWINDGVHHNKLCLRSADYSLPKDEIDPLISKSSSRFVTRKVNCAIVVVDIADAFKAFQAADFKSLEAIKEIYSSPVFKKLSDNPILILTHGDMLSSEERIEARIKLCEWLNILESNGVYDIVCLTEFGFLAEDSDPVSAYAMAEAVYRALLMSDRTHPPKRNFIDWVLVALSWLMYFVAAFFAFLAQIFAKLSHKDGRLRL